MRLAWIFFSQRNEVLGLVGERLREAHELDGLCTVAEGVVATVGVAKGNGVGVGPVAKVGVIAKELTEACDGGGKGSVGAGSAGLLERGLDELARVRAWRFVAQAEEAQFVAGGGGLGRLVAQRVA